ncbi:hypothetical protein STSP_68520 [Streptomyces jeddahensis]|uniref:Uncharacterized protein n=1 Tax=Streptomyces jeddahensis TaxID=1716141 RepID=A0A177HFQ8_9ACTN|nr:hypothetical protein STSP_68520 [Streptomyces jeddahensis]
MAAFWVSQLRVGVEMTLQFPLTVCGLLIGAMTRLGGMLLFVLPLPTMYV